MRRICIATSTRADWGLLSPLANALRDLPNVRLQILATNMHLLERYGNTIDEILADGFTIDAQVPMDAQGDTPTERVIAMAQCLSGTALALSAIKPDLIVILGDRYEMLAVAEAAAMMGIPIAHIAGGEISEGAIDNSLRHAITKLSALHFAATEQYSKRIIQMGEMPDTVFNAGALGVWNILHQQLMPLDELNTSLGFDLHEGKYILATYHPATLDSKSPVEGCLAMLSAIQKFLDSDADHRALITFPNNDAGGELIIKAITNFGKSNPQKAKVVKSLGMLRYLSAVKHSAFVAGNSSSGIVEVPSLGVPTVDIGIRQQGRICGPSVIHCADDEQSVARAFETALSADFRAIAAKRENPYQKADTVKTIADVLANVDLGSLKIKKFHDIPI